VNALVYHFQDIKENFIDEPLRPGIVHRLDKDTSGVLVVAKNKPAHEYLASQFRNRAIRKYYLAIVQGKPAQPAGKIKTRLIRDPRHRQRFTWAKDTPLSGDAKSKGKVGVTFYKVLRTSVLETSSAYSLILFKPLTGRTHQLRVHALRLGCPILGDPIYGRPDKYFSEATLMLHAYRITLQLPGQAENSSFKAPIPLRFKQILSRFKTN
jgi:23S rRNA pseudouridine1911/1915/1917 synthase